MIPWQLLGGVALVAGLAGFGSGAWFTSSAAEVKVLQAQKSATEKVNKADKALQTQKDAYAKRDKEAKDAVLAKQEADTKAADAIAARSAAEARLGRIHYNNLNQEKTDVQANLRSLGHVDYLMRAGWVRLYDAALSPASAADSATHAGAGAPAAASGRTDFAASQVTEWDALTVHTINAEKWSDCRRQVKDLLDFLNSTQ